MYFAGTTGPRFHNPYYSSYTMDDEVTIARGRLKLRCDRRTVYGPEAPGKFLYTQGLVVSKFTFTYGYVEIMAQFPTGKGMWPCLWMMPASQSWPPEIDIAEYIGGKGLMHFGLAHGEMVGTKWESTYDGLTDYGEDYRVFGLHWQKGSLTWFVDDVVVKHVTGNFVPSEPMYLVLSNGVGSKVSQTGEPDQDTWFPNALNVEYVRIWDRL